MSLQVWALHIEDHEVDLLSSFKSCFSLEEWVPCHEDIVVEPLP